MKKIINGILLALVVTVWVFIVYRIFNNQTIPEVEPTNIVTQQSQGFIQKDTFNMTELYSDPFRVGAVKIKPKIKKTVPDQSQSKPSVNVRRYVDPRQKRNEMVLKNNLIKSCHYKGFVQNLNASQPLGLFTFNGKLLRKQPSESLSTEYKVIQIFRDSAWIKIVEKDEKITILKS